MRVHAPVEARKAIPKVVILTGMSGAGRRASAHIMEDLGWFVVDNLPPSLIPNLIETAALGGIDRLAIGIDVRTRSMFEQLPEVFSRLSGMNIEPEILFLEAADQVIIRRQESAKRPLPMQGNGTLMEALAKERRMISELRASADVVIDTSELTVRQLSSRIGHIYGSEQQTPLAVHVLTFGFKNGVPVDSDVVLDVRFLPNPHWVPELRPKTGLSPEVSGYVLSQPGAKEYLDQVVKMFDTMLPGYLRESKRQVTIAIGCTGGKHRSTAMATELAARLNAKGVQVSVQHRDLGKE